MTDPAPPPASLPPQAPPPEGDPSHPRLHPEHVQAADAIAAAASTAEGAADALALRAAADGDAMLALLAEALDRSAASLCALRPGRRSG